MITATYYMCSGSGHIALDMGNGTCSEWNHRGMLEGSHYYAYSGGCAASCSGGGDTTCNGGVGNYYVVTGASGWDFRQLHLNANASSKTCDRCALGLVGATGNVTSTHVHADNRQYAPRRSAWYTAAGTTCHSSVRGEGDQLLAPGIQGVKDGLIPIGEENPLLRRIAGRLTIAVDIVGVVPVHRGRLGPVPVEIEGAVRQRGMREQQEGVG